MCQLTSPSLKMVFELPRAAGINTAATRSGIRSLACLPDPLAASGTAGGARPLRRTAAVDEVEEQADHLSGHEKDLRAIGQADEQVQAAEDSDRADDRRGRRT